MITGSNERTEVVSTTDLSVTFPHVPSFAVYRSNVVHSVEKCLDSKPVVYVTGPPGIGKTTVLAQFAQNTRTSVSVFLKPESLGMSTPDLVRQEIAAQVRHLLRIHVVDDSPIPEGEYSQLLTLLAKRAKQAIGNVYFVVDGFGDQSVDFQKSMLQRLLPLSLAPSEFRFVLAGAGPAPALTEYRVPFQTVHLSGLAHPEATPLFSDLVADGATVDALVNAVGDGHPGRLTELREQLEMGVPPSEVINKASAEYHDLIRQSLAMALGRDPANGYLLAALAFGRRDYTTDEIAIVASVDLPTAAHGLASMPFASLGKRGWRLASPMHQEVAQLVAAEHRRPVLRRYADLHLNRSSTSLHYPLAAEYLSDGGYAEEISSLVTPKTLQEAVGQSNDLTVAASLARTAIAVADLDNQIPAVIAHAFFAATAATLHEASGLDAVATALCALARFDEGLELARLCPINVDRLALLALISRHQFVAGQRVPNGSKSTIDELIDVAGSTISPGRAIEIGADLFAFHPEGALRLAKLATAADEDRRTRDRLLTAVVLAAPRSHEREVRDREALSLFLSELQDQRGRRLVEAATRRPGDASVVTLLDDLGLFTGDDGLPFLETIAPVIARASAGEAVEVMTKLVKSVIAASHTRRPRLRVLASVVESAAGTAPLPELQEAIQSISAVIDAEDVAPTVDDLYLRAQVCAVRQPFDEGEFSGLVNAASRIEDLASRLEALARLRAALEHTRDLVAATDHISTIESLLVRTAQEVTTDSGVQEDVLAPGLVVLARCNLSLSRAIARMANTGDRRRALDTLCMVEHLESPDSSASELETVLHAIHGSQDDIERARLLTAVVRFIGSQASSDKSEIHGPVQWLIDQTLRIRAMPHQVRILAELIKALPRQYSGYRFAQGTLVDLLGHAAHHEHRPWVLLGAIADLGPTRLTTPPDGLARFLASAVDAPLIANEEVAESYFRAVDIMLLAAAAKAMSGTLTGADLNTIEGVLERFPNPLDRISGWERLAVRLWGLGDDANWRQVVATRLLPQFDALAHGDIALRSQAMVLSAAPMFLYSVQLLEQRLSGFESDVVEAAWTRVLHSLVRGVSVDEAYLDESRTRGRPIDDAGVQNVVTVLSKLAGEDQIVLGIEHISQSLQTFSTSLSDAQRRHVGRQLRSVIGERLPERDGVGHEGYVVWAEALIHLIETRSLKGPELDGLARRTRSIENVSDRAFVLALLGRIASKNKDKERLLSEAEATCREIRSVSDRFSRVVSVAEALRDFDEAAARRLIAEFWTQLGTDPSEGRRHGNVLRRAIDLAYSISPDFAESLAEAVDKDEARHVSRQYARRRALLDRSRAILDPREDTLPADSRSRAPVAAAMKALAVLRAGRAVVPRPRDALRKVLPHMQRPFEESHAFFALQLETMLLIRGRPEQHRALVDATFVAIASGVEFFAALLSQQRGLAPTGLEPRSTADDGESVFVGPGEAAKGYSFLRDWLERHATERIVLVDAWFNGADMSFLATCLEACPRVPVTVVTGFEALEDEDPLDHYERAWSSTFDARPPDCTFVVVGYQDPGRSAGKCPIHDRYLFADSRALKLGTSIGGLGGQRGAGIGPPPAGEIEVVSEKYLGPILGGATRLNGRALRIQKFSLGSN